jgi:hypothetical protein
MPGSPSKLLTPQKDTTSAPLRDKLFTMTMEKNMTFLQVLAPVYPQHWLQTHEQKEKPSKKSTMATSMSHLYSFKSLSGKRSSRCNTHLTPFTVPPSNIQSEPITHSNRCHMGIPKIRHKQSRIHAIRWRTPFSSIRRPQNAMDRS